MTNSPAKLNHKLSSMRIKSRVCRRSWRHVNYNTIFFYSFFLKESLSFNNSLSPPFCFHFLVSRTCRYNWLFSGFASGWVWGKLIIVVRTLSRTRNTLFVVSVHSFSNIKKWPCINPPFFFYFSHRSDTFQLFRRKGGLLTKNARLL